MYIDKLTVDEMTLDKMTVDEMTINNMTVDEVIVFVDKMSVYKMSWSTLGV